MSLTVTVYLLILDKGILIYKEIDEAAVLPCLKINGDYSNSESIKRDFLKKTKLKVSKGNFVFLSKLDNESAIYYAVIDINDGHNLKILSPSLCGSKQIGLMAIDIPKWDGAGKICVEAFKKNKNFENAFRFINSNDTFDYYDARSKRIIKRVFNNIASMWQFDRPDVVIETIRGITGVECFKVNAAGTSEKGLIGIIGKKEMESQLRGSKPMEVNTVTRHFSNSIYNLWSSFQNAFNNHSCRIEAYRKNLKSVGTNKTASIGFYIEDTTLLGTYYRKNGKNMVPLYLFNLKEFWDIFLATKGLLFVIFQQTGCNIDNMFFITKHDYEHLLKKKLIFSIDDIEAQFFDDPHLIGTSIPL